MDIVPFLIVFFIGYFVGKKISLREKAQGLLNKILGKKVKKFLSYKLFVLNYLRNRLNFEAIFFVFSI